LDGGRGRGDCTHLDLFPNVLLLLRLESELNEDLLKLLVDVVDAKLLELVGLFSHPSLLVSSLTRKGKVETNVEDLETVNIENTDNICCRPSTLHRDVDAVDDPLEEVVVDSLGEGVANGRSLSGVEGNLVDGSFWRRKVSSREKKGRHGRERTSSTSSLSFHDTTRQDFRDLRPVDLQQVRHELRNALILDVSVPLLVHRKLDVSEPQNRRQHAEYLVLLALRQPNNVHRLERLGPVNDVVDSRNFEAT
jgi:hypothetical protein